MQDLKHLSSHKSGLLKSGGIRKIRRSGKSYFPRLSMPTGKRREQLKHLLLFIAVVLALTPCSVFIMKKIPKAAVGVNSWARSAAEAAKAPPVSTFDTAFALLSGAAGSPEALTARTTDGQVLHYSINGGLQKRVHDFLATSQVPYGAFVAIEPESGRILAMTSHSSADPKWADSSFFELYPMASLFKIITASAALEAKKITPESVVEFRGRAYSENPRKWGAASRGNNRMDVTYAMGKSINPVYGRIASDIAGKTSVMESVDRFGFNQTLLPGTPAKESKAAEPRSSSELMLMGAGLDHDVKISPLHAAVMMAAIANGGRMMAPGMVDSITDARGGQKETFAPKEIRRLVTPETAVSLKRMLSSTVTSGTSRKAFHDRRGRRKVAVDIAAKTGSINGTDPRGHYSWFAAFAPANNPKIALVALVINQDKWKIKSSQVGEQALDEFFNR